MVTYNRLPVLFSELSSIGGMVDLDDVNIIFAYQWRSRDKSYQWVSRREDSGLK